MKTILLSLFFFSLVMAGCKSKKVAHSEPMVDKPDIPLHDELTPDQAVLTVEVIEANEELTVAKYVSTQKTGFGFSAFLKPGQKVNIKAFPESLRDKNTPQVIVVEQVMVQGSDTPTLRFVGLFKKG